MNLDRDILRASPAQPMTARASFSLSHRLVRVLWQICWLVLARWTPPMASPWRILLLRLFGARIERGAAIGANTKVWLPRNLQMMEFSSLAPGADCYCMATITIGRRTVVSQGAYLCAGSHDVRDRNFQLICKPITIGDDVWIAAGAFVAPGVSVGDGAVLSARGCAFQDLKPWTIYRGNPAEPLRKRQWREDVA